MAIPTGRDRGNKRPSPSNRTNSNQTRQKQSTQANNLPKPGGKRRRPTPEKEPKQTPSNNENRLPKRVNKTSRISSQENKREIKRESVKKPERLHNPYDEEDIFTDESQSKRRNIKSSNKKSNAYDYDEYDDYNDDEEYYEDEYESDNDFEDFEDDYDDLDDYDDEYEDDDYDDYDDEEEIAYGYASNDDIDDEVEYQKEAYDYYDIDEEEVEAGRKKRNRKNKGKKQKKQKENYINTKELKLEPFGQGMDGKRRKLKVSEFDDRQNKEKNAKIITLVIITLLIALIALGVKNALIPPKTVTEEDIKSVALNTIGETKFPKERAGAFAEDFMKAYMSVGTENNAKNALRFFYQGYVGQEDFNPYNADTLVESSNVNVSGRYASDIIIAPRVYESYSINDNSGYFVVGTMIKPKVILTEEESMSQQELKFENTNARWLFFQVNVYYDEKSDKLMIDETSPSLVPPSQVANVSEKPEETKIGTGEKADDNTQKEIQNVLHGYIQNYAQASVSDTSTIDSFLKKDAQPPAKDGLNGEVTLSGDALNSIMYTAYKSIEPNELKVNVIVKWKIATSPEKSTEVLGFVQYQSRYVATLQKDSSGEWKIYNFDGYKYLPDESSVENVKNEPS